MGFRPFACAAVLLCWTLPLGAQQAQSIEIAFSAGRVTLSAQNTSARVILSEWARLGGATIVNGEQVAGPAMTLELVDMPERQALDIILRDAAGYLLAPRRVDSSGDSAFDRVIILASSAAPRNPPPTPVAAAAPRPTLRRPPVLVQQQPANPDALIGGGGFDPFGGQGSTTDPQQLGNPIAIPQPLVGQDPSSVYDPNNPTGSGGLQEEPAPTGVAPTASNPFGIPFGSSSTPGVVTPAPEPEQ